MAQFEKKSRDEGLARRNASWVDNSIWVVCRHIPNFIPTEIEKLQARVEAFEMRITKEMQELVQDSLVRLRLKLPGCKGAFRFVREGVL